MGTSRRLVWASSTFVTMLHEAGISKRLSQTKVLSQVQVSGAVLHRQTILNAPIVDRATIVHWMEVSFLATSNEPH